MTESEATKHLKTHIEYLKHAWKPHPDYNVLESISMAINALEEKQKNRWIPVSERLPDNHNNILICQSDGYVNVGYYSANEFKDMNSCPYNNVIAWKPLPHPFEKN